MPTLLSCPDTGIGSLPAGPKTKEKTGKFLVANDPPIRSTLATLLSQMSNLQQVFTSSDQKVDKLISHYQESVVNLALLGNRVERLSKDFEEMKVETIEHNTWSTTTAAEFQKRVEALEQKEQARSEDRKAKAALAIAVISMVTSFAVAVIQKLL